MQLGEETESARTAVLDVHRDAFGRDAEAHLVGRLRRDGVESISVIAKTDSRIVGHALFSEAQLVLETNVIRIGALGPVGVLRAHQGHGVGTALIHEGLRLCWKRTWRAVIVLGNPAYYGRFGFHRADAWSIRCEFDVPSPAFMILFADQAIPGPGVARYHPAFAAV